MQEEKKYKIALVGYQLSDGGLERLISNLSLYFGSKQIDIHNIIITDAISYPYSGVLLNVGKLKFSNFKIVNKVYSYFYMRNYIKSNKFDFIIDFRYRLNPIVEVLFSSFIYKNTKTIYTVLSSKIDNYLPKNIIFSNFITKNKHSVVCCSNVIKENLIVDYHVKSCERIYCPIAIDEINILSKELISIEYQYIIAAGRFDETNVKQLDKLIDSYSKTILPKKNIHLVLLGEGVNKQKFINFANEKSIGDYVHFLGFQNNPFKFFSNAKYLVLCSKHEGQGTVIVEALACNIPVVSLDCVCGPNEVITNGFNGLLVENQNFKKLTDAMNLMIEDNELYENCKRNSIKSVENFTIQKIGKEWLDLMQIKSNE
jgi:glycosyltransferase involved in cell wall biosynthesis